MRPGSASGVAAVVTAALLCGAGTAPAAPSAEAPAAACRSDAPVLIDAVPPALAKLSAEAANRRATGRGAVVAVVDSGVGANPHFPRGSVLPGKSFVTGDKDKTGRTDIFGHGTAIAGIIAARPVAKSGVVGLAPDAKILPVRVFVGGAADGNEVAVEDLPRIDRMAEGIVWAADNGADIINVSISAPDNDPVLTAAVARAQKMGALVVASAGNRVDANSVNATPLVDGARYPAALPGVLGVTAADTATEQVTEASVHGTHVDVAAPGTQVLTTHFRGDCQLAPTVPSTSFATGYVSAAAALLREAFPDATAAHLSRRLTETATRSLVGRDNVAGFGSIRPVAALTTALDARAGAQQADANAATEQEPVITVAASIDPREGARQDTAWWVALGSAGVLLLLLLGGLTAGRARGQRP